MKTPMHLYLELVLLINQLSLTIIFQKIYQYLKMKISNMKISKLKFDFIKLTKLSLLITLIFAFNSCNECPLEEAPPFYLCESRIVTLERFNPNYTITPGPTPQEPIVTLDPDYNISMFEFPFNKKSSGSFPNDYRFKNNAQIPVVNTPFMVGDQKYYLAIMDTYPTNSELIGDILVKDVNLTPPNIYSDIRVFGSITRVFTNAVINENAQDFCDFVTNQSAIFEDAFKNMTLLNRYGLNQPNVTINDHSATPTVILNDKFEILGTLGAVGLPEPLANIVDLFNQRKLELPTFDLRVRTGDVYAYIARNGRRIVFQVTEMRQSTIAPFRRRMSIMFFNVDNS